MRCLVGVRTPKIERWIHGYTFDDWRKLSGEQIDPASYPVARFNPSDEEAARRKRIDWALGEEPPGVPRLVTSKLPTSGTGDGWLAGLFRRPGSDANARARVVKEGMGWAELPFGDDLKADLFYPADRPGAKWPVVIWLHPVHVSERLVERVAVGVHRLGLPARAAAVDPGIRETRLRRPGVRSDRLRGARAGPHATSIAAIRSGR